MVFKSFLRGCSYCCLILCSFQFKARPFNAKIITLKGRLGVPVMERKSLTRPIAPTLTTEAKPKSSEEESVKREEFRANPLPIGILEGVKVRITIIVASSIMKYRFYVIINTLCIL